MQGVLGGLRFARFGAEAHHLLRLTQGRHGERKCVLRHRIEGREMALAMLLLSAGVIELDDLHHFRVIQVCDGRIIKRNMPVLAHAEAAEINRLRRQQIGVAAAFLDRL